MLPVAITDRVQPGNVCVPFHWNDEHGEYLTVNALTNDAVDADSLQPELKVCAVRLRPIAGAATRPVPDWLRSAPELDRRREVLSVRASSPAWTPTRSGVPVLPPSAPVRARGPAVGGRTARRDLLTRRDPEQLESRRRGPLVLVGLADRQRRGVRRPGWPPACPVVPAGHHERRHARGSRRVPARW